MRVVLPASGWEMMAKVRRREISFAAAAGTGLVAADVVKGSRLVAFRRVIGNPVSFQPLAKSSREQFLEKLQRREAVVGVEDLAGDGG